MIEEQYIRAQKILVENIDKLTAIAELLLEKEVIFKTDLESILGPRPFKKEEPIESKTKANKEPEPEVNEKTKEEE